jgi:hypothetical protein
MALGKGKASHSSSGASMSKYDVEVEGRLKALEKIAHDDCGTTGGDASLEKRVAIIEASLRKLDKLGYKDIEEITAAELA